MLKPDLKCLTANRTLVQGVHGSQWTECGDRGFGQLLTGMDLSSASTHADPTHNAAGTKPGCGRNAPTLPH